LDVHLQSPPIYLGGYTPRPRAIEKIVIQSRSVHGAARRGRVD
jgi:hypothetical protein